MNPQLRKVFEHVSGWMNPETYGHEHDGYVTFEEDPKTRRRDAFLWKLDGSHEHLHKMWLCGETFVRGEKC